MDSSSPSTIVMIAGNHDSGSRIELPELDGGGDYDLLQLEPSGDGLVSLILRKRP